MRICVIGGGVAGALLAWRLASSGAPLEVLLAPGPAGAADASAASGGAVRAFEVDPAQRALALESMAELLADPTLQRWAAFIRCGSLYLPSDPSGLPAAAAQINAVLPGSATVIDAAGLRAAGWAGISDDTLAIREEQAGYLSPHRLRESVLADLTAGGAVQLLPAGPVSELAAGQFTLAGTRYRCDVVVLATGAWTPNLLAAAGYGANGLTTKGIQYTIQRATGIPTTAFVDDRSELFGRPAEGGVLLGLPTSAWQAPPTGIGADRALARRAAELAADRFTALAIEDAGTAEPVTAVDCYAPDGLLALRPVPGADGWLFTFTGGSGGAAKTVLAASRRAAGQLVEQVPRTPVEPVASSTPSPTGWSSSEIMTDPAAAQVPYFHAVGIGAGPANLSLAALLQARTDASIALFDKSSGSAWHSALLHPGVRMQTSWMKDLVSLVDPTHPLSFLNYLVTEGRLFAMLNSQFDVIPRREYMRYLAWAAGQLDNVHFDTPIDEVTFVEGEGFYSISDGRTVARSEHLVLGVGTRPTIPAGFIGLPEDRLFIADHLAGHLDAMAADPTAPVAVIGGGQTGVEAVLRLLAKGFTNIRWLGRRQWFQTIDDSPAANDFYRPAHQQFLQGLTRSTRRRLVQEAIPTGDALTPGALKTLYQANYDGMLERGSFPVSMLPGRDVTEAEVDGDQLVLTATTAERIEKHRVRYAIIAVGRQLAPVPFSAELRDRIDIDENGEMIVDEDYSVRWKGMNGHRIYALNRSRFSHGIPDANLSLLPVRAALVLNSMLGAEVFTIRDELCPVQWG